MDQDQVVNKGLTDSLAELVEALRKEDVLVSSATWLHSTEDGEWHLIIATPSLELQGPLAVHQIVQRLVYKLKLPISMPRVSIIRPQDPFVTSIQQDYPTPLEEPKVWIVSGNSNVSSVSSAVSIMPIDKLIAYPTGWPPQR